MLSMIFSQELPSSIGWREELETALTALALLLRDEKTISAYEVHLSGLVPVLSHCLKGGVASDSSKVATRVELFKRAFAESAQQMPADLDIRYVCCSLVTNSMGLPTPTHTHLFHPPPHTHTHTYSTPHTPHSLTYSTPTHTLTYSTPHPHTHSLIPPHTHTHLFHPHTQHGQQ